MRFTFLHAADLHLGSPLAGLMVKDAEVARRIGLAGRTAFTALVDAALAVPVAFAVIAGDVFDTEWRDASIGLFFARELARLARAGIPVFLLKGNHDAESQVTRAITLPDGVTTFSARRAETFRLDHCRVALHGRSFPERAVYENYALGYPPAVPGWFNIGVLHSALDRQSRLHDPYAPCSLADLASRGYDYWALGHLHEFEIVARDPHVVYPGNLQGRSVRECGPKGAVLVEVEDGAVAGIRHVATAPARWAMVEVALDGIDDEAEAYRAIERALKAAAAAAEDVMLAARLRLTGRTRLGRRFAAAIGDVRAEAQAAGHRVHPDIWLEKLVLDLADPAPARPADAALESLDLAALLTGLEHDPTLRAALDAEIGRLVPKLGAIPFEPPLAEELDALLAEARALVLGRTERVG